MKRKISIILVLLLLLVFGCGNSATAFATEGNITYTDVLQDLQKDVTFDTSKYPADTSNNGLSVITLAESVNNELFVYVYSPAGHDATSINIATDKDKLSFIHYQLQLVDKSGVLGKYKVYGFTVASDAERYYELSGIYRAFIDGVDDVPAGGNTVSEVSYAVGVAYTFKGTGDAVQITTTQVETITITDKYVGFLRYPSRAVPLLSSTQIDVHFVAFSTDKPMDKLLEADVYYTTQDYYSRVGGVPETHTLDNEKTDNYAYLDCFKDVKYQNGGWFSVDYNWNSIERTESFLASEDRGQMYESGIFDVEYQRPVDDSSVEIIGAQDWVLRFAVTEYTRSSYDTSLYHIVETNCTRVSDVSILRLSFLTEGVPYNLGVVDNKQSGAVDPDTGEPLPDNDEKPGNTTITVPAVETFADKLKTIAMWVVGALIVIVAWKVIRWIVNFIRGK